MQIKPLNVPMTTLIVFKDIPTCTLSVNVTAITENASLTQGALVEPLYKNLKLTACNMDAPNNSVIFHPQLLVVLHLDQQLACMNAKHSAEIVWCWNVLVSKAPEYKVMLAPMEIKSPSAL